MISYDNEWPGHGPWEGELLMIPDAQCIMLFFRYKVPQHCVVSGWWRMERDVF